ncbi:PH domain-containing protein [Convivina praedatoris]|uniref:YokE-like PH domain-containing protein n=1 Tax=Convivina praedatoris TaxID=2880963 RepID=A0ABN8HA69_9LACO|nr:PH domain-containing protein [Convivina sp. LMG 32447]CAH1850000.1 hypothetical protein R078138_00048 [Convivina sp. LMG 32447]CAH1851176.1 hypothetical protein LMG032447_00284 [Convivina sp. LMG 32447]CAH1851195.1 hypothetical protein R077815_00282 [Convivina sp. LMG 32447]
MIQIKKFVVLKDFVKAVENIIYATGSRIVLIIITDRRIMFLNKNILIGADYRKIQLNQINVVSYSTCIALGNISITNCSNTTLIKNVSKQTVSIFIDKLNNFLDKQKSCSADHQQPNSFLDNLIKLKELLDNGIITQKVFETKKKQILGI